MTPLGDDRYCFACGPENPIGLKVRSVREEGTAEIVWNPSREFQGFKGILHGGITSTLLDEAMAHAAINAVTARISVRFRKPVRTDREIRVRARVTGRKGRLIRVTTTLVQEEETRASAEGEFILSR